MMRRMMYLYPLLCLLFSCPLISGAQTTGVLCMAEDFSDTLFPKAGWTADGVTRVTTSGAFVSSPAAASFGTYNASLTLPQVGNPLSLKFFLGRTTSTTTKIMVVEASVESDNSGFLSLDTFTHDSTLAGAFVQCEINLSAYTNQPAVWIRFRKVSATTSPWRVDDIEVYNIPFLPVSLVKFEGSWDEGSGVSLNWQTAGECQNAFFEIRRAGMDHMFTVIGTIPGAGTTYTSREYRFNDPVPPVPVAYYRLAQGDYDGTLALSSTIQVKTSPEESPALKILGIHAGSDGIVLVNWSCHDYEPVTVSIVDMSGIEVFRQDVSGGPGCDILLKTKLSAGIYVMIVANSRQKATRKFSVDF